MLIEAVTIIGALANYHKTKTSYNKKVGPEKFGNSFESFC